MNMVRLHRPRQPHPPGLPASTERTRRRYAEQPWALQRPTSFVVAACECLRSPLKDDKIYMEPLRVHRSNSSRVFPPLDRSRSHGRVLGGNGRSCWSRIQFNP